MPRPKKAGGPEPKTRSRNGCWPCKHRKIKCGEEKPQCQNCERAAETCDYSIRLNWDGRNKRKGGTTPEPAFIINAPLQPPPDSTRPLNLPRATEPPQRPTLRHSESQGSNRSLESIEEYKRKLQFTPEETSHPQYDTSPRPSWIDPALTDSSTYDNGRQPLLDMPKSPHHLSGVLQNDMSYGPRDTHSSNAAYPSPSSNVNSPAAHHLVMPSMPMVHSRQSSHSQMPPPFQGPFSTFQPFGMSRKASDDINNPEHANKRMKLSPAHDFNENLFPTHSPQYGLFGTGGEATSTMTGAHAFNARHSPSFSNMGVPPTPTASSVTSDENHHRSMSKTASVPQESPDLRRLSVKSLLSDDSPADSGNETPYIASTVTTPTMDYGVDRGFRDLDIPQNNDSAALDGMSPILSRLQSIHNEVDPKEDDYLPPEFGFGLYGSNSAHEQGGYYATPVTVTIPRALTPLPPILQDNPMNLLYFHHFLNHTARILVPHDCAANPFKSILPQMAVRDDNLLHLLLAYSASHRALLLKHPEPANRIATWVKDVFPTLRRALEDPDHHITNSNLATAIMLASLEIISPNAFEVTVSWQTHLTVARRMILARGGPESVHRKDKVSYFLSRWFAYLDVLGSLSGGIKTSDTTTSPLSSGIYWANTDADDDFQIDCLLGFTSRCVSILARIAELARQCDGERIDPNTGDIKEDWQPSEETVREAEQLKLDLQDARMHRYKGCPHRPSSSSSPSAASSAAYPASSSSSSARKDSEAGWGLLEMVATNEAFHWAGLVHLNRRILGKRSEDLEVQISVREIVSALYKVRKGGTAEACLLFPMFTAGCDARERGQREVIMERLRCVEETGMTQVHKARTLIEKVWETGRPWETLVTGEFFG
ncbi:MAG: hypothetical protein LQ350_008410 [Teloschistes chrysophthalmus]|nr:MAG: hypothetical protein LQ350_008410 [Niorma chrysophthalma]